MQRRTLLRGVLGATALGAAGGCASMTGTLIAPDSATVAAAEAARRRPGRSVVTARLRASASEIDLGGRTVATWAYDEQVPGPLLRARAGDLLRVAVDNRLPASTSVHWHGLALRNDMDGVPGVTQDPIDPSGSFTYEFTAPDPGTYFYHPHSGVQLDRGLYGVLVVDDPGEAAAYDDEWVVVLDDWIDGTGTTPDAVLDELLRSGGSMMGSMGGSHAASGGSDLIGHGGDVTHAAYLINGRTPEAPSAFLGRPGQRIRLRVVNAAADTAFRVALGQHELTVTHSDGFPVEPVATDAVLIGMGERYDVVVTLGDGVFPLVACAEGKGSAALAVVRTGGGEAPPATSQPRELTGRVLLGTDLLVAESVRLPKRTVDRRLDLRLGGSMMRYRWTINGRTFADSEPLQLRQGERVAVRIANATMMFHPMHLHGHTFALRDGGARKDTVTVRPMETLEVELDADNPGQWAAHCHNLYHAEAGMMTTLSYRA